MVPESRRAGLNLTQHEPRTAVLLITLSGGLDPLGTRRVRTLLDQRSDLSGYRRVILDLAGLTLLSSEGVELLVELHRRARTGRFVLILVGSSHPRVERPLRLAGALPLFTTRPTIDHALAGTNRDGLGHDYRPRAR
jgi:anti-anti-sigma factor